MRPSCSDLYIRRRWTELTERQAGARGGWIARARGDGRFYLWSRRARAVDILCILNVDLRRQGRRCRCSTEVPCMSPTQDSVYMENSTSSTVLAVGLVVSDSVFRKLPTPAFLFLSVPPRDLERSGRAWLLGTLTLYFAKQQLLHLRIPPSLHRAISLPSGLCAPRLPR